MNTWRRLTVSGALAAHLMLAACTPKPPAVVALSSGPLTASVLPDEPAGVKCRDQQKAEELIQRADSLVALAPEQALTLYQEALALMPESSRIHYRIGMIHRKQEAWDKAATAFASATRFAPTFANFWFEYGYSLLQLAKKGQKDWKEARNAFEKCIDTDPNYSECYYHIGMVHLHLDDERKALEAYTRSILIQPNGVDRYVTLADLYLRLDFVLEAETVLNEAKAFARPGERGLFAVHVLLSEIARIRGDSAATLTELEAAKVVAGTEGLEPIMILYMLGSAYALTAPPRRAEAIANLKGFTARACNKFKRPIFANECANSEAILARLGQVKP